MKALNSEGVFVGFFGKVLVGVLHVFVDGPCKFQALRGVSVVPKVGGALSPTTVCILVFRVATLRGRCSRKISRLATWHNRCMNRARTSL